MFSKLSVISNVLKLLKLNFKNFQNQFREIRNDGDLWPEPTRTVQSPTMDYSKELKTKVRTLESVSVSVWFVNVCVCVHVFRNGTSVHLDLSKKRGTEYD